MARLGVIRSPIREALLRLTEHGLVESTGRSAHVSPKRRETLRIETGAAM